MMVNHHIKGICFIMCLYFSLMTASPVDVCYDSVTRTFKECPSPYICVIYTLKGYCFKVNGKHDDTPVVYKIPKGNPHHQTIVIYFCC